MAGVSGVVDYFFFNNGRTRCLEMSAPLYAGCPVESIRARCTEQLQPVLRTSYQQLNAHGGARAKV